MKRIVKENISFKRGQGTKKSLQIGKYSPETLDKERNLFLVKMASVGMLAHWVEIVKDHIWRLNLENKLTDKTDRSRFNIDTFEIFNTLDSEWIEKRFDIENIQYPFIFVMDPYQPSQKVIEAKDADEALKVLLKLEYAESESWDYLTIMKKIISVLEDEGEESI